MQCRQANQGEKGVEESSSGGRNFKDFAAEASSWPVFAWTGARRAAAGASSPCIGSALIPEALAHLVELFLEIIDKIRGLKLERPPLLSPGRPQLVELVSNGVAL